MLSSVNSFVRPCLAKEWLPARILRVIPQVVLQPAPAFVQPLRHLVHREENNFFGLVLFWLFAHARAPRCVPRL
jgi:hypothetical protein